MTLQLHVLCGYPSYEESGAEWRKPTDYDAYNFVKALKGEAFKGYSDFKVGGSKIVRLKADDPSFAFDQFGRWAARMIGEAGIASAYLVPVPSSSSTAVDTNPKGIRLCEAISRSNAELVPLDALWWRQAMVPAHKGGPRDVAKLLPFLVLKPDMPTDRPVVLVDDVVTTGGHLKACAARLTANGFPPPALAIGAAQTVWEHPSHSMFLKFPARSLD